MAPRIGIGGRLYDGLIVAASWLHYAVLSPLGKSDEGGAAWFRRRLNPPLPAATKAPRIWIHAVSAGESKVAGLLRQSLLERDPSLSIVLSSTTYSGFDRVAALAGKLDSFVMPLDTSTAQHRVFETVRPDLLVLVESEYWPAQFAAAEAANVPVAVVNATLSERSFARHQRYSGIARRTIARAARIFAQDAAIAERYRTLGVAPDRLQVTGNLKLVPPQGAALAPRSGPPLVVFGNVHAEELPVLAPAIAAMRRARPELRIALVPRYPGKLPPDRLRQHLGSDLEITTGITGVENGAGLLWIDRMGTLATAYAQATIGVVCGTFAPIGGHDLSEPLHLGAASVYGPHVERQRALHTALTAANCSTQVQDADDLPAAIMRLLDDASRRDEMRVRFALLADSAEAGLAAITDQLLHMVPGAGQRVG